MNKTTDFTYDYLKNITSPKFFDYNELFEIIKGRREGEFLNITLNEFTSEIGNDLRFEENFNGDAVALKEWNIEDDDDLVFQDPDFG